MLTLIFRHIYAGGDSDLEQAYSQEFRMKYIFAETHQQFADWCREHQVDRRQVKFIPANDRLMGLGIATDDKIYLPALKPPADE